MGAMAIRETVLPKPALVLTAMTNPARAHAVAAMTAGRGDGEDGEEVLPPDDENRDSQTEDHCQRYPGHRLRSRRPRRNRIDPGEHHEDEAAAEEEPLGRLRQRRMTEHAQGRCDQEEHDKYAQQEPSDEADPAIVVLAGSAIRAHHVFRLGSGRISVMYTWSCPDHDGCHGQGSPASRSGRPAPLPAGAQTMRGCPFMSGSGVAPAS